MAGHSQFKNIMYRKGAQDAKRARLFAKIIREIMVAARSGQAEPSANPRLRAALAAARDANMPRDTVERAIRRARGGEEGAVYDEVRYEGYGPGGVAIIVEALTDNRKRTASDVRTAFAKHGGVLGETNSVSFQFKRVGQIVYGPEAASADAMFEAALDAGADNVESSASGHEITAAPGSSRACGRRSRPSSAVPSARGWCGSRKSRCRWRMRSVPGVSSSSSISSRTTTTSRRFRRTSRLPTISWRGS